MSFLENGPLQSSRSVLQNIQRRCKSSKIKINDVKAVRDGTPLQTKYIVPRKKGTAPIKKNSSYSPFWGAKFYGEFHGVL